MPSVPLFIIISRIQCPRHRLDLDTVMAMDKSRYILTRTLHLLLPPELLAAAAVQEASHLHRALLPHQLDHQLPPLHFPVLRRLHLQDADGVHCRILWRRLLGLLNFPCLVQVVATIMINNTQRPVVLALASVRYAREVMNLCLTHLFVCHLCRRTWLIYLPILLNLDLRHQELVLARVSFPLLVAVV